MERIKNFFKDESGASAVEYGLLVALIAVVIIGAVTALGTNLTGNFNDSRQLAIASRLRLVLHGRLCGPGGRRCRRPGPSSAAGSISLTELAKSQEGPTHEERRHQGDGLADHGGAVIVGVGSNELLAHGAVGLGPQPRNLSFRMRGRCPWPVL